MNRRTAYAAIMILVAGTACFRHNRQAAEDGPNDRESVVEAAVLDYLNALPRSPRPDTLFLAIDGRPPDDGFILRFNKSPVPVAAATAADSAGNRLAISGFHWTSPAKARLQCRYRSESPRTYEMEKEEGRWRVKQVILKFRF